MRNGEQAMLELKNIKKDYPAGGGKVEALKGITLNFRKSEFVCVLGPSGCGKTTLLNIIGGLDRYTSGDLQIRGRSTKDFKDRDWDAYRNHSVGFVFQSYNLIPHQSVLQNVELALSLSGVKKSERKQRAEKALCEVGLGSQLYKKPGELSGGQMQRVAIARALVNDPEIILADEPTGALDTETSIQVMEILKRISSERLIIMVTHNPELAELYATRTVKMLDGNIIDDSRPYGTDELKESEGGEDNQGLSESSRRAAKKAKKEKKPSMSFATSFMLSLKNLFTKKGRTALTSFAGSIGIIGISLILAISQGTTDYINATQENALSSYPLTIERTSVDLTQLMKTFMNISRSDVDHPNDAVYKKSAVYDMINSLNDIDTQENDLTAFKKFLEEKMLSAGEDTDESSAISGIQYGYDLPLSVYTENEEGKVIHSDTSELMNNLISEYMGVDMSARLSGNSGSSGLMKAMNSMNSMSSQGAVMWQELLSDKNGEKISGTLKKQYDLVYGDWPQSYNEIVLVLDKNNELDDLTLYALGLISEERIDEIMNAAVNGSDLSQDEKSWSYSEICSRDYRVVLVSDCYTKDETSGLYTDLRESDAGIKYLYDNGIKLKVSGVIRPNEDASSTMLTGSVGYTKELTEYVINRSAESEAIKAQMNNKDVDVTSGLLFKNTSELKNSEKESLFKEYVAAAGEKAKAELYVAIKSIPPEQTISAAENQAMQGATRESIEQTLTAAFAQSMGLSSDQVSKYLSAMSDDELYDTYKKAIREQVTAQYSEGVKSGFAGFDDAKLALLLDNEIASFTTEQCAEYYDSALEFSENSYENNLIRLGYMDLDSPATVNIYASSFADKDVIEDMISDYNDSVDELHKIKYTDYVGIMMSSVTTIIDAVTYVLIAFVAISLIVSSIMIGVITLISVQERTKEIGILRAIGASKRNVSGMFNAETVIIGFMSGILGVGITYLLCIPINAIIRSLTGIQSLTAFLPPVAAVILVLISVMLTLVSGIIPSRSAAKKDPVVALRSE